MLGGVLIDAKGQAWPEGSRELARRLGSLDPALDIAAQAVRKGFIHLRPQSGAMRVSLCAGRFEDKTLASALYALHERAPPRILLAVLAGEDWNYGICASLADFAGHAEELMAGKPFQRQPWLLVEKDQRVLTSSPTFARALPLVRLWRETRGRLPQNLLFMLRAANLLDRSVLARPSRRSSRLVLDHFGGGFRAVMRPCESLLQVGRDLGDVYDHRYGAWVADTYGRALSERRLHLASVDATFQVSNHASVRARYDRVLIPWSDRSGVAILGLSIGRSLAAAA